MREHAPTPMYRQRSLAVIRQMSDREFFQEVAWTCFRAWKDEERMDFLDRNDDAISEFNAYEEDREMVDDYIAVLEGEMMRRGIFDSRYQVTIVKRIEERQ